MAEETAARLPSDPGGDHHPAAARWLGKAELDRLGALGRHLDPIDAEPHRYRLLFSAPVPGYDAHAARLVGASQRAMSTLLEVLADAPGTATAPPAALARQLAAWARDRGLDATAPVALRAVLVWSRLHGLVLLEIEGNLAPWASTPTCSSKSRSPPCSAASRGAAAHDAGRDRADSCRGDTAQPYRVHSSLFRCIPTWSGSAQLCPVRMGSPFHQAYAVPGLVAVATRSQRPATCSDRSSRRAKDL